MKPASCLAARRAEAILLPLTQRGGAGCCAGHQMDKVLVRFMMVKGQLSERADRGDRIQVVDIELSPRAGGGRWHSRRPGSYHGEIAARPRSRSRHVLALKYCSLTYENLSRRRFYNERTSMLVAGCSSIWVLDHPGKPLSAEVACVQLF